MTAKEAKQQKKQIEAAASEMLRALEFIQRHHYMDLPISVMKMITTAIYQAKGDGK